MDPGAATKPGSDTAATGAAFPDDGPRVGLI